MVERVRDPLVPVFFASESVLHLQVCLSGGWHNEGMEVLLLEHNDIVIVTLSLVMVVPSGEKVGLLVGDAGLVMEDKVIFC